MEQSSDGAGGGAGELQLADYQNLEKTLRSMSEDQQAACCPALFERAAASWWNPR